MKVYLFIVAFFLLTFYSKAQTETEQTLLEKLAGVDSDSLRADTYIDLHNITFISDLNKSREYANDILQIGLKTGSLKFIQKGYGSLARCARKRRDYDVVLPYDLQALFYAKKVIDPDNLFLLYRQTAADYLDVVKLTQALPYLDTCQQMLSSLNNPSYEAKLNQLYGWYYANMNQSKKAIPYYKRALQTFQAINDEKMIPEVEYTLGNCFLTIREPDSASNYLYQALEKYKKRGSMGRQADCYGFLGQCYVLNGNTDKGIELYRNAVELEKQSFDSASQSLSLIDLGRCYLIKKDTTTALSYAHQSETILNKLNFTYGNVVLNTFWGQFYSDVKHFDKAESYFKKANAMAIENKLSDLKIDNEKYWAQLRYKEKKTAAADSLVYSYIRQLLLNREPATINKELNTLLKRNPNLDSATAANIRLLYTPGGADILRKKSGIQSLSSISNMDSILNLNPYSLASASFDSSIMASDDKQLLELETKYKTKLISDSLKIEKQNTEVANAEVQRRNTILIGASVCLLLLAAGFFLQYKNRKRAERDTAKIEMLQNEIHHRVKNNLGVINRLIEVAGKGGANNISLQSLQTRVTAIELLHKRLYNDKVTGNISLQEYLLELTAAIQTMFETDKKIDIHVNAPVEVSSKTAEKIGLIINELVTNSYKYAFDEQGGNINIEANATEAHEYKLTVADNGKGFTTAKKKSYGMKLIAGLSHELGGNFAFSNNNGTEFVLQFADTI